jgi:hypothetical protein
MPLTDLVQGPDRVTDLTQNSQDCFEIVTVSTMMFNKQNYKIFNGSLGVLCTFRPFRSCFLFVRKVEDVSSTLSCSKETQSGKTWPALNQVCYVLGYLSF